MSGRMNLIGCSRACIIYTGEVLNDFVTKIQTRHENEFRNRMKNSRPRVFRKIFIRNLLCIGTNLGVSHIYNETPLDRTQTGIFRKYN